MENKEKDSEISVIDRKMLQEVMKIFITIF